MSEPLIVVTNGTAGEGYWAVYYLLESGRFRVRATVRRPDSPLADRLRQLNVGGRRCEVVQAATDDEPALRRAFSGASGIYGTTVYDIYARQYRADNPAEMAQGRALIAAARACDGLQHFVFQTMTRFETHPEDRGLPSPIHFRTKWQLEEMIKEAGLPWTWLRQPAYMRQLKFGLQWPNRLVYPYPPETRLSFVAEEDLGKLVAALFADRAGFLGQAVNGVSEVVTPQEIAARAHRLRPAFNPRYRQASWLENAVFDQVVVRLKPAFRYPSQVNANLRAGNLFAMTLDDRQRCQQLVSPLPLTTLEDWLREWWQRR
ncbi:MAG: NmrA family NAD(P)-binding protein [Gammaproteobacteria bacterium]|nr:NmrA family NAD(P)-binding protein [Gammaproteobacteria bacterium]